jgi:hypothetical protein
MPDGNVTIRAVHEIVGLALRYDGHPSPESRAKGGAGYGDRNRLTRFSKLVMARDFWRQALDP